MMSVQQNQYPTLPVELCELIINELARETDTMDHIKACTLASRTFLNCSRKHIFRTIKVLTQDSDLDEEDEALILAQVRSTTRFTGLFVTNPNLAQYVRNLHIFILPADHDDQLFAKTLRTLTNVEKLSLESRQDYSWIYWNEISVEVRASLENNITSPSLVELHISSIHGFPHFLLPCARSLSHLNIDYTEFSAEIPPETRIPPTLYLKSLSFGKSALGIRTLLQANFDGSQSSAISFAHLKHLALPRLCTSDFRAAAEVLELVVSINSLALVGKSHVNLTVKSCYTNYLSVTPFNNSSFQNMRDSLQITGLKTLKKFNITIMDFLTGPLTVHPLPHTFQNWAGINVLEEIELELCTGDDGISSTVEDLKRTLDILANRDGFPVLRGVVVNVQHFRDGPVQVGVNDDLRQALMLLDGIDSRVCINISSH